MAELLHCKSHEVMKIRTKRGETLKEVDFVAIHIGGVRYRCMETQDMGLGITKYDDSNMDESILITPEVSNKIRLK